MRPALRRHRDHMVAGRGQGENRRNDSGGGAVEQSHAGVLAGAEVVPRQPGERLVDQGRADPLFGEIVPEVAVPGQKIAAVAREIEQATASVRCDPRPNDVEAVDAPPEFVEGTGEMSAARIADHGIERVPETILHDPAAPGISPPIPIAGRVPYRDSRQFTWKSTDWLYYVHKIRLHRRHGQIEANAVYR